MSKSRGQAAETGEPGLNGHSSVETGGGENPEILTVESLTTVYHDGEKHPKGSRWEIPKDRATELEKSGAVKVLKTAGIKGEGRFKP